jgi:hypothetical protein
MEKKNRRSETGAVPRPRRLVFASLVFVGLALSAVSGCATLAPQQRAILADPTMQFDAEAKHEAALHHAIDNREGSMGGTGVSGGGCGCN